MKRTYIKNLTEGECVFSEYVRNGGKEIYPAKIDIMSIAETLPIAPDSGPDLRITAG